MNWFIEYLDKGKPGPVALLQGEELQGWQWVSIQDILSVKHKCTKAQKHCFGGTSSYDGVLDLEELISERVDQLQVDYPQAR